MKFRLRQLESALGRGPRSDLCVTCGGLSLETIFGAMEVQDGLTQGDLAQAVQIIDELDGQPATCSVCNSLTASGELQELDD